MSDVPAPVEPNTTTNAEPTGPTPAADPNAWSGAFDAFSNALDWLKKNPKPAYVIFALSVVTEVVNLATGHATQNIFASITNPDPSTSTAGSILGFIAICVASIITPRYALALADKKPFSTKDLFNGRKRTYWLIALTSILSTLCLIGAAFLFLVPLIWVVPWVVLAVYIAADKGTGPGTSIKENKHLVKDNLGKPWGIVGVNLLFTFAATIVLSFIPYVGEVLASLAGAFFSLLGAISYASLYRWLQLHGSKEQEV